MSSPNLNHRQPRQEGVPRLARGAEKRQAARGISDAGAWEGRRGRGDRSFFVLHWIFWMRFDMDLIYNMYMICFFGIRFEGYDRFDIFMDWWIHVNGEWYGCDMCFVFFWWLAEIAIADDVYDIDLWIYDMDIEILIFCLQRHFDEKIWI